MKNIESSDINIANLRHLLKTQSKTITIRAVNWRIPVLHGNSDKLMGYMKFKFKVEFDKNGEVMSIAEESKFLAA